MFGLYLQHFNSFEATYGALGGAIIFLLWLWLTNIVLLVGAEINDVIADLRANKSVAAAALANPLDVVEDPLGRGAEGLHAVVLDELVDPVVGGGERGHPGAHV